MSRGFFISGTDTGVGKTAVAAALLHRLAQTGRRVAGIKPVAAGCELTPEGWRNDDASQLLAQGNVPLRYDEVNPIALKAAIAPHLAARDAAMTLSVDALHSACTALTARTDVLVVEGAGGWLVPLNDEETLADLAARLNYPVILVVGMRLGCLNHALLSAEAISRRGLRLAGWVANCIDPHMQRVDDNIASLQARLPAPRLATLPYQAELDIARLAAMLDIEALANFPWADETGNTLWKHAEF